MTTFLLHLHREWREQRTALAFLATLLALAGTIGLGFTLPAHQLGDPLVTSITAGACLLALLMTVGGNLLGAGERVSFLERLPGGLAAAFRAKLAFLGLGVVASLALAWTLVATSSLVRPTTPFVGGLGEGWSPIHVALAAGLVLWTFAVSAWIPRGTVALPVAAFAFVAAAWPFAIGQLEGGPAYAFERTELTLFVVLLAVAPLAASSRAFVGARRFGGSGLRAAGVGLGTSALVLAPAWLFTGTRLVLSRRIDPAAESFQILRTLVSGDFAFVNGRQREAGWERTFLLRVDLRSGSWCEIDGLAGCEALDPRYTFFTAGTGLYQDAEGHDLLLEGRVAWRISPEGALVPVEGLAEVFESSGPWRAHVRVHDRQRVAIEDPYRGAEYAHEDVPASMARFFDVLRPTPAGWLGLDDHGDSVVFDPDTGSARPIELEGYGTYSPLTADGRAFFLDGRELVLGNPADGQRERIAGWIPSLHLQPATGYGTAPGPDDAVLLLSEGRLYRFDEEHLEVVVVAEGLEENCLLLDDGAVLVPRRRWLERLDPWTGEAEVLFPVE